MGVSHKKPLAWTIYFSFSAMATDRFVPLGHSTKTLTTGLFLLTCPYFLSHFLSKGCGGCTSLSREARGALDSG